MDERTPRTRRNGRPATGRTAAVVLLAALVSGCGSAETRPSAGASASADATGTVVSAPPSDAPASASTAPSAQATPLPDPAAWALVWSDEFDGPAGAPPDRATWLYDIGGGGWGNNERQFYTDDAENAGLDGDGNLQLTVRAGDGSFACHYGPCEYTSARLLTKGRYEFQYGRVEARIRVPSGFGIWPAFWMLGADINAVGWPRCGEIDVMEFVGRRPNEILGTIHGPRYSASSSIGRTVDLGRPVADDFHVFEIAWWPGHIAWFLDGVKYHEVSRADVAPNDWVFDHPFFILLNVAVGGTLGGLVDPDLVLPASMAVDYVRVYQEAGT